MQLILPFLAGFLTCSIAWRLDQGKYDDIAFPLIILACTLGIMVVRKSPR